MEIFKSDMLQVGVADRKLNFSDYRHFSRPWSLKAQLIAVDWLPDTQQIVRAYFRIRDEQFWGRIATWSVYNSNCPEHFVMKLTETLLGEKENTVTVSQIIKMTGRMCKVHADPCVFINGNRRSYLYSIGRVTRK